VYLGLPISYDLGSIIAGLSFICGVLIYYLVNLNWAEMAVRAKNRRDEMQTKIELDDY
jgi:hypothetical protein